VVAIARWAPVPVDRVLAPPVRLLGLVGVQDPGNVGSAIRTAEALGATGVIAFDGSAHPGGAKALRGAMGSTFRLPVASARLADVLPELRRREIRIAATLAEGGEPPSAAALAAPVLMLLGNEGAGLPDTLAAEADIRITIPMRAGVESLNVAVTAALLLWEAAGRRRIAS
jgi:TrmH family RNA methyltransferase